MTVNLKPEVVINFFDFKIKANTTLQFLSDNCRANWILKKNCGIMSFTATILGCFILFQLGDSMSISQLEGKISQLEQRLDVST